MLLKPISFPGTKETLKPEASLFFSPANFFALATYAHAELFSGLEHVWEALPRIQTYLLEQFEQSLGNIETEIPPGAFLSNPETISIGRGTVVEPGAFIQGPCMIGTNCSIRHGAYIRGNVIAGNGCVIGHTTEIKNSILFDHAHAAHFAYLGDSILGNRANLGAGVKCANLRLDRAPIAIHWQERCYPTGLRKFGAVIGDGCQIGCNAVLNPGTLMQKGASGLPCEVLSGVISRK